MRTLLLVTALAFLAGAPTSNLSAADAAVPAAAAAVPAVNQTLLERCISLASQAADSAHKGADIAQKAAGLPFAGASARTNADAAATKANDASGLLSDFKNLQSGQAPSPTGTLAQTASGSLNLGERLKGLPGAAVLQQIFAVPGLGDALIKNLPVDKVPGFDAIKGLLGK
ncbi:MAG: hypothetical protein H0X38_06590 [Planctomycetes bacterium]|nr:hypothetical protein [Planctomycetota bacterium]